MQTLSSLLIVAIDFNINIQHSVTCGKPQLPVEKQLLRKFQLYLKSVISKHLFLTKHLPLPFMKAPSITSEVKNELGPKSATNTCSLWSLWMFCKTAIIP